LGGQYAKVSPSSFIHCPVKKSKLKRPKRKDAAAENEDDNHVNNEDTH